MTTPLGRAQYLRTVTENSSPWLPAGNFPLLVFSLDPAIPYDYCAQLVASERGAVVEWRNCPREWAKRVVLTGLYLYPVDQQDMVIGMVMSHARRVVLLTGKPYDPVKVLQAYGYELINPDQLPPLPTTPPTSPTVSNTAD